VSEGITPHILNLSTRERREMVSFTPQLLYPQGSRPQDHLDRMLGRPQSWSGHGGKDKKIPCLSLPGTELLPSSPQ